MKCHVCRKKPAVYDKKLGILPCQPCQTRLSHYTQKGKVQEMTTDSIKEQRKEFYDDIHPAHRNGEANSEFRDRWGREAMKRQGFTEKEIDNAKPVYRGSDTYYKS